MGNIGDRIRRFREQNGLSQVELAKRANVSKQTMYKYENGIVTNIPSDKIEIFSKIFGISPAVLMGWENNDLEDSNFVLSDFEKKLVLAYRKSEMKEAVCMLLGILMEKRDDGAAQAI